MNNLILPIIPGYEPESVILRTDHTIIFRAESLLLSRPVIIKTLLSPFAQDVQIASLFRKEAQILGRLNHPNLIPIYDLIDHPLHLSLVAPWFPNTLRSLLVQHPLSLHHTAALLDQLASALAALHFNNIIHGNINPSHIWLDDAENVFLGGQLLGQSWCLDAAAQIETVPDRSDYFPPEMASSGSLTKQSDVYSMGILARICLHGLMQSTDVTADNPEASAAREKKIPKTISMVLDIASAARMIDRYRDPQEFAAAFRAAIPDHRLKPAQPIPHELTPREIEILEWVAQGKDDKEIAEILGIAEGTVGWHIRQNIYRKLSVNRRKNAVERAKILGLISTTALPEKHTRPTDSKDVDIDPIQYQTPVVGNPYRGLSSFSEKDHSVFFGREELCRDILTHFKDNRRFLILVGPSGSGKTSVIQAGVVPALRHGALFGSDRWVIVSLTPGTHPIENLAVKLTQALGRPHENLLQMLSSGPSGLIDTVRALLSQNGLVELFLIIDQFEELYTHVTDSSQQEKLIELLVSAVSHPDSRIRVIIAVRADFYHRPLQHRRMASLLQNNTRLVLPMNHEELEASILRPAELAGITLEPRLISEIIHDFQNRSGALPLLQYTLSVLYDFREDHTLTLSSYQKHGGIGNLLGEKANSLFKELKPRGKAVALQVFMRMIAVSEDYEVTIRPATIADLKAMDDSDQVDEVLSLFGRARLLTFDKHPRQESAIVSITHEALIRHWDILQDLVSKLRLDLQIQHRLLRDVREWEAEKRSTEFLVTGARLERYRQFQADTSITLSRLEMEFIEACHTRQQELERVQRQSELMKSTLRQQLNNLQRFALVTLAIAFGISFFLLIAVVISHREAQYRAVTSTSHYLAAYAFAQQQNPIGNDEYVALLALRSLKEVYEPVADMVLVRASEQLPIGLLFTSSDMKMTSLDYSHDGRVIVAGKENGTVEMLDANSGELIHTFEGHTDTIWKVSISRNGQYLLTASDDQTAILWSLQTYQPLHTFQLEGPARYAVFSPDDKLILIVTPYGYATIWDIGQNSERNIFSIGEIEQNSGIVGIFSPDGQYILTGGNSMNAVLMNMKDGNVVYSLPGHTDSIYAAAFSPDGRRFVTGSLDNTARIWDTATGELLHVLEGHSSSVRSVQFSPDGQYVLTASADRTARLWDVETGEEVHRFRGHLGRVRSAVFSPDGSRIITASEDGTVKIWNGLPITTVRVLDGHSGELFGVAVSPDNTLIATSGADHNIQLWNSANHTLTKVLSDHDRTVTNVVFSPDGTQLASSSIDQTVRLWDIQTGSEIMRLEGHTDEIWGLAFSPDGRFIATGSHDHTVRLWDVVTGETIHVFDTSLPVFQSVVFSPDGKYLAAGGLDRQAYIWNLSTYELMTVLVGHNDEVTGITTTPDGKFVATSSRDTTAKLWDFATGQLIRTFAGHDNSVNDVEISHNGKYLLTVSADRVARLWDVASGEQIRTFSGHKGALWAGAFSSDDKSIVTISLEGYARIWDTDYHDLMQRVCSLLSRDLTDVERTQAFITDTDPTCPVSS